MIYGSVIRSSTINRAQGTLCENVLTDILVTRISPMEIYQDSLGAISSTEHVQGLRNVNHVEVKYQYVLDWVDKKRIAVTYSPSADHLADPFTKALIGENFERLRAGITIMSITDTR